MNAHPETRIKIPGLKYLRFDPQLKHHVEEFNQETPLSIIGQALFGLFRTNPELFSTITDSPFLDRSKVSTTVKFLQTTQKDGAIERSFRLAQKVKHQRAETSARKAFPQRAGYLGLYVFGLLSIPEIARQERISFQLVNEKINKALDRIYANSTDEVKKRFERFKLRKSPSKSISAQKLLKLSVASGLMNSPELQRQGRRGIRYAFHNVFAIDLDKSEIELLRKSNISPNRLRWQGVLSLRDSPNQQIIDQMNIYDYKMAMKLAEPPIVPLTKISSFVSELNNVVIGPRKVSYLINFLKKYNIPVGEVSGKKRQQRYVFIARSSIPQIEKIFQDENVLTAFLSGLKKRIPRNPKS